MEKQEWKEEGILKMLLPQAGQTGVCQWVGRAASQSGFIFVVGLFVCFPRFLKERTNEKGNLSMQRHLDGLSQRGDLGCDIVCV